MRPPAGGDKPRPYNTGYVPFQGPRRGFGGKMRPRRRLRRKGLLGTHSSSARRGRCPHRPAGGCVHPPLRLIARAALVVCCDSPGPPPGHTARCAPPLPGPPPKPSGDGRGFGGERSRSGRSELCRLRRSEGSGACGDAVTVRLFATPGFPPPRAGLRAARAALRSPSLRSIRAAHNGSPLLFYPISGQKERGVIPLVLFGLFTSPRR